MSVSWNLVALIVTALSLGPSFAHVLEAWPRLVLWPAELWRDATVFHAQYLAFAIVGAPLDIGAILVTAVVAYRMRADRFRFQLALAAALLFAVALAIWLSWVAPANGILATWVPGPIPDDFSAVRMRWETGHMVIAALKLVGFAILVLAVTARTSDPLHK